MANREQFELHGTWVHRGSLCESPDSLQDPTNKYLENLQDSRSLKLYLGNTIKEAVLSRFFVSVISGAILEPALTHYAIEQVQAFFYVMPRVKGDGITVSLVRQRMFRYDRPVTKEMVPRLSEVTPKKPYIEWVFNLEETMVSSSLVCPGATSPEEHERNSQTTRLMYEEVFTKDLADIKAAIVRILKTGEGESLALKLFGEKVEIWTSEAVEKMAQESVKGGKLKPFSFKTFVATLSAHVSRSNAYNWFDEEDRENIKVAYITRCEELLRV